MLNALPITISAWFWEDDSSEGDSQPLVSKHECNSNNGYAIHLNSGHPSAYYFSNYDIINSIDLDGQSQSLPIPASGVWHCLTISISESIFNYYLDGVNILESSFTGNLGFVTNTLSDLYFGKVAGTCSIDLPDEAWHHLGNLDDIGIWNRALTPGEIQNLYTGQCPTLATNCTSLPSNLQQGLVGYWPFCGNANDESGNGNDGTVNGAMLTEDRFGNAESAYSFDGAQNFIRVENSSSVSIEGSVSISAWVLLPYSNLIEEPQGLVTKWYYSGFDVCNGQEFDSYTLVAYDADLSGAVNYIGSTNLNSINGNQVLGPDVQNDSIWKHLVYTHDVASGGILYLNGTQIASQTTSGDICPSTNPLYFGADNDNGVLHRFLNGSLDDIGIWNRALTPEEVQELYTLDACTFTIYDTVYTYETIYDTVTTYVTVTDTLLIDITFAGFEGQPSWLNTVTVFPNPASDHITIDYGNFALMAGYNTIITNAAGATVYSSAVNTQQVDVDINAWGAMGVYYMSIYDANGALVAVRHIVLE
jgi:hypothetical protein